MTTKKTIVMVDGSYYLRRTQYLFGSMVPQEAAALLSCIVQAHLVDEESGKKDSLVRTYFYDCEPLARKIVNPISKETIDTSELPSTKWRIEYLDCIRRERQIMIRLGYIQGWDEWKLKQEPMAGLMNKTIRPEELTGADVTWVSRQKGVDVKIGMDMTRIALKRLADRVILIAGDGDFAPVVEMAREEGLEVILDPLGGTASRQLIENVDWVRTTAIDDAKSRLKWQGGQERKSAERPAAKSSIDSSSPVKQHESATTGSDYMAGGSFN